MQIDTFEYRTMAAALDHCHTLTGWPLNMSDIKQHLDTELTYLPHVDKCHVYSCITHTHTQSVADPHIWPKNL